LFFRELTKRIIDIWSASEDKAYTKLLIQAKFNSSMKFDFKFQDLFDNIRKVLNVVFTALKDYSYVKDFPTEYLVDEYLSPLIVLKFRFLINDFFDYQQVQKYATTFVGTFWEQIKK
jgi:hypothetical protein